MPRLCYILPRYDPDSEEHFYHTYDFLRHLAREVDLCLIVERSKGPVDVPGARVVYLQRWVRPFRFLETLVAVVAARLRGWRTFFVHYSIAGAIGAGVVTRLTGGRCYYWHCGLVHLFFRPWSPSREALRAKFGVELPLRLALRVAQTLVTGTPSMARYYARVFGVPLERIVVLPNEIDLARFQAAPTPAAARAALGVAHREVVLFLHRLSPRKGAELLPEIVRLVTAARPQVLFLIVGDGPSRARVEESIVGAGLALHVRFTGWVPNRDVPRYYAAADLYIMPSLEEGFPRVLLEAMAMGTPFVAADVGGVREICAPAQQRWLVPPGDAPRFAAAVVEALERPDLRALLAAAGRERVRAFDLPVVTRLFLTQILSREE